VRSILLLLLSLWLSSPALAASLPDASQLKHDNVGNVCCYRQGNRQRLTQTGFALSFEAFSQFNLSDVIVD
jgi:hypothetical protein